MDTPCDLSTIHHPIGELLDLSRSSDPSVGYELSAAQVEFYQREGYVSGVPLLNEDQVELMRNELAAFVTPDHDGRDFWYEYHTNESATPDTVLFHALGAWRVGPAFHDLLWLPTFGRVASQLLQGPVRFWHDQLFCKPARHGGVVAWHQDYSYWTRTGPMNHLTCWIALDDADADNGCVQYIPRSHDWNLLPITGLAGDMHAIRDVLDETQWQQMQRPVSASLKAGEATFHHPLMVHGSQENRTERPRRAAVLNVVRDGVRSHSDDPLLEGVPAIPNGSPLGGQFFPLLTPNE